MQIIKRIGLFGIIASLLVAINVAPVQAITEADRGSVNKDTVYYDPNSCDDSPGTAVGGKTGVYLVGDNVTDAAKTEIQKQVRGIVMSNANNRSAANAVDVLNEDKDKVAKVGTIIIALGTYGDLGDNINKTIAKAKEINPEAVIYWQDVIKANPAASKAANKQIYTKQDQGYKVISWFKTVYPDSNPEEDEADLNDNKHYLAEDKVLPSDAGKAAMASTISLAIGASGTTDTATACGCGLGVSTNGGAGLENVPEPWRSLILNAAATTNPALKDHVTGVDPRLVAATLWVENRSWPDFNKEWAVSPAGAAGPWQFIPSSWEAMGADGDGDGRKDRNNPKDAVFAAFMHQKGSAGKPIIEGYRGDPDAGMNLVFRRDRKNLLSFMASYNGSGAPNGVALKDFPRNENSDYVIMSYWLLASNFTKVFRPEQNKFTDPRTGDQAAGGGNTAATGAGCAQGGEVVGNTVFYSQSDPRWANVGFDGNRSTLAASGCGVTSFAMVAATLTGNHNITPKEVSKIWEAKGYATPDGTAWAAFNPGGAVTEYGLKSKVIASGRRLTQADLDQIAEALRAGQLVIATGTKAKNGGSTLFTSGGHIIVIRGVTADGKFLVNDPKDKVDTKESTSKQWDKQVFLTESYGAWAISK